jgi:serine phosphatase RsbU (regulator of sigma subunit)
LTRVPLGSVLRVGRQFLKHEWRTAREIQQQEELDRELRRANSYVQGLLPAPLTDGPIRTEWHYEPCANLGGDAFGYGMLTDTRFAFYIVDVSGHGAGAAMHSVTVMNLLRQRALPRTDMLQPVEVLATLNAMFPMESHGGMYFTMWYGVYDLATRRVDFASAGHHPAFLVPADRSAAIPIRSAGGLIGADPNTKYRAGSAEIPENSSIYLFSDGVFEIVTIDGLEWGLKDLVPHLLRGPVPGVGEAQRLYRDVRNLARPGLDDDFSLLVAQFR